VSSCRNSAWCIWIVSATEIGEKLRTAESARAIFAGQMKEATENSSRATPEQRRDFEETLGGLRAQLEAMQATENALRAEESSLMNSIVSEQARWSDFNGRLDELERTLPRR
jgi:septal ring factor EnvC (AmiA/AmiB activator)